MARITDCDDYATSIQIPQFIKATQLSNGAPEMNGFRPVMHTGGFCAVFPYTAQGKKFAVRCWHAYLDGVQDRTRKIAEFLSNSKLPYFVDFQYVDEGIVTSKGVMPIVIMDWVDAKPLKKYLASVINNLKALDDLATNFLLMVKDLHNHGISHGDLQHGNILVKSDGNIVLVDYDSMFVPSLSGYSNEITGLYGYQHPARFLTKKVSPKADYFSELIIYTSIKTLAKYPFLWEQLQMADTDTLIFSKEDIESKGNSNIFREISQDPYLKQLVEAIATELSYSSIDNLHPLESLEPCEKENNSKIQILESIKNELSQLDETTEVLKEKKWLENIDLRISTVDINDLGAHLEYILRLKRLAVDSKKRKEVVDEMRSEFKDNGYIPKKSNINSKSVLDDLRKEWNV